jgi:hypothetical protein
MYDVGCREVYYRCTMFDVRRTMCEITKCIRTAEQFNIYRILQVCDTRTPMEFNC